MKKTPKTQLAELEAVHSWARNAKIGDDYIYHGSTLKRNDEVFKLVGRLADAGVVFPYQKAGLYLMRRLSHLGARFVHWAGDLA